MNGDLFEGQRFDRTLAPGAMLLGGLASAIDEALLDGVEQVSARAPFRHLITPGGHTMSVAMTNCGAVGWVSDAGGYRYDERDPQSGRRWPEMPEVFRRLASDAAARAGFDDFVPDACLINRYAAGARLTLHQDRDELDLLAPIVSVSLGLPAVFLLGGLQRSDKQERIPLNHGDVVVWGGPSRLRFHGVLPVKEGLHPRMGGWRINLTFRKTGSDQ